MAHWSNPTEHTTLRLDVISHVNCGPWVATMRPCRFTDREARRLQCRTSMLGEEVLVGGGGDGAGGGREHMATLYFPFNFSVNLKLL